MMDRFLRGSNTLPTARHAADRLEGRIWRPRLDPCVREARFAAAE
jgi:hypothetical protein